MPLYFPKEHPLSQFNSNFYLESGRYGKHIYIFKFNERGAQVVLDTDELSSLVYELVFANDYIWDYDELKFGKVIYGNDVSDILNKTVLILEAIKNESRSRENS